MCGRVFADFSPQRIAAITRTRNLQRNRNYNRNYNIAPTSNLICISHSTHNLNTEDQSAEEAKEPKFQTSKFSNNIPKETHGIVKDSDIENLELETINPERKVLFLEWGWKFPTFFVINCRSEEMEQKKMFSKATRCCVIIGGYFEWAKVGKVYAFKSKIKDHLIIASLLNSSGKVVTLTQPSPPEFINVHHRIGVFLDQDLVDIWNDPEISTPDALKLVYEAQKQLFTNLDVYEVPQLVSNQMQKTNKNIMRLEDYLDHQKERGGAITSFFQKKSSKPKVYKEPILRRELKKYSKSKRIHENSNPKKLKNSKRIKL